MGNTEYSTLPCHPSTWLCWTINWIRYSKNWNVLQKLTLRLFSKTSKMDRLDIFMLENNTVMERSKLLCTQADMTNLTSRMQKMDVVDICTQERANTKCKFYKVTNLTIFASLHKDVPMGCKNSLTWTTFEIPQCELSYFWEKYETTLQSLPFHSISSTFAW